MKIQKRNLGFIFLLCIVIVIAIFIYLKTFFNPAAKADTSNLMKGIKAEAVSGKSADSLFINNTANFSIELLKQTKNNEENSLISPLSVILSLAMAANGAEHETYQQMQSVLGDEIVLEDFNQYLYSYINSLPNGAKSKINLANSIWLRDVKGLRIEKEFLQTNANYYKAAIFKKPFDKQTIEDINDWTKETTEGMIDQIVDEIDSNTIMYILNTVIFDARWENVYKKDDVYDFTFQNINGTCKSVDGMNSIEYSYLEDEKATGFMKSYDNDTYRFVALLPREGISLDEYINSLTGAELIMMLNDVQDTAVHVTLPKFEYESSINMNDALTNLGMPIAFSEDAADFGKLGTSDKNIYIKEVLHKTFITVDERGTKAGAATKIVMDTKGVDMYEKSLILDRPFLYAIVDSSTNIPLFIGTVINLEN